MTFNPLLEADVGKQEGGGEEEEGGGGGGEKEEKKKEKKKEREKSKTNTILVARQNRLGIKFPEPVRAQLLSL